MVGMTANGFGLGEVAITKSLIEKQIKQMLAEVYSVIKKDGGQFLLSGYGQLFTAHNRQKISFMLVLICMRKAKSANMNVSYNFCQRYNACRQGRNLKNKSSEYATQFI